jgi:hypothetical protein
VCTAGNLFSWGMKKSSLFKTLCIAWLIAGTLDILGAIFILGKGNAAGTFHYIAGAVTGKNVTLDTTTSLLLGAVFHYLISFCWTVLYFLVYKMVRFDKLPLILSALLYGAFIYFSMRYIFVPLLGHLPPPKSIDRSQVPLIIKNILILAVAFGITLKYFAARLYTAEK